MSFSIIILAAGKGKRMNSKIPKVFHKVGNHPMIYHILDTSMSLKPKFVSLVISEGLHVYKSEIKQKYKKVFFARQPKQLGTADAVKSCLSNLKNANSKVLVMYADVPFIETKTLKRVVNLTSSKEMKLLAFKKEEYRY